MERGQLLYTVDNLVIASMLLLYGSQSSKYITSAFPLP